MRRADTCDARTPIVVHQCAADALDLDLTDTALPTTMAPCTWPPARVPHHEHWVRE